MSRNPIGKHAMGIQVELGALYDAKTGNLFSGFSLWKVEDTKSSQKMWVADDTKLEISSSLEKTRKNSNIDLETSVGVNFGTVKLGGCMKYLQSINNNTYQARVGIACIKTNQVRFIPIETLMKMTCVYKTSTIFLTATHFVFEIAEGAIGNVTFKKKMFFIWRT